MSKKSPEVSACLSQSKDLKIDCNVISDQILSHEADVLNKFIHPNIAPVLNICQRVDGISYNAPLSRVGTKLMILEEAKPLDMSEMLQMDWKDRVKTCVDIGEFFCTTKTDNKLVTNLYWVLYYVFEVDMRRYISFLSQLFVMKEVCYWYDLGSATAVEMRIQNTVV